MSTKKMTRDSARTSILVVDDESGIRTMLRKFLSKEFSVSVASSAQEALGLLEKNSFDVALVDVNMPEMSGKEFFWMCRKQYPEMQFVLMTGRPEFADAINAVKDGAFYYLLKPFDLRFLDSMILSAVQEKSRVSGTGFLDAGIIKDIGSKYRIVRSLGAGTSGVVLLVENKENKYAMKLLHCNNTDSNYTDKMDRFIREAEILMRMKNEHVVKIIEHNLGKEDETPYIIMEFVDGMPLSRYIKENKLDMNQRISIIRQIAETLDCVHGHGVIHRDIKPGNILLTNDLFVKISDFGICHVAGSSLTICDEILGSTSYMAPESFKFGRKPDAKVDIFSLGVVGYEMLTGIRPFEEDNVNDTINALKNNKPTEPVKLNPGIPVWMQDVLAKMLDKNPRRRFGSCAEISKIIKHHLSGDGEKKLTFTARILRSMIPNDNVWS